MALGGSKKADLREQTARTCCTRTLHSHPARKHPALAYCTRKHVQNKKSTRVGRHLTLPARGFRTILTSHTNTYIGCNAKVTIITIPYHTGPKPTHTGTQDTTVQPLTNFLVQHRITLLRYEGKILALGIYFLSCSRHNTQDIYTYKNTNK